jgi:hypothetical protein
VQIVSKPGAREKEASQPDDNNYLPLGWQKE